MIVVNCRFLTQELTGVQRFAEEITVALLGMREDMRLVAPPGELRTRQLGGHLVEQIGSSSGHRWEQWELPRMLHREQGAPLLLSLMNTGPVLYRNQVVTHHDITYARFPETYTRRFRSAYRMLSGVTLRRARRIITVSEFSCGEISQLYGIPTNRISVIHNAASSGFHQPHDGETDPPYMLAVSSLLPHKNVDFLVRSFQRYVEESGSSTVLKLVGAPQSVSVGAADTPLRSALCVEQLGRVSDDQLQWLYSHARAFVFPSLYEGFGIPPIEAQSAGLPVIAARAASIPEVLGESALYFDPHDEDSLIRQIQAIDESRTRREELRELSILNARRYSWRNSAELASAILDDVLDD